MADRVSKETRSRVMSQIKGRGNKGTEMQMVAILRKHGLTGWRRHQPVFGRPDFVFKTSKVAIFVDGCFWHCCPKHGHIPASNQTYWMPKLARNQRRDKLVTKSLRASGWTVLRFWQHALRHESATIRRIKSALKKPSLHLLLLATATTIRLVVSL